MLGEFADTDGRAMKPDNYLSLYEDCFAPLRHEPVKLLEIGVLKGRSLKMWRRWFTNAVIVGVDKNEATRQHESPGDGVFVRIGHQHDHAFLSQLAVEFGDFDIVIDDGSHRWEDQHATLDFYWPRPWRFYAVEDVQTSFVPCYWEWRGPREPEPTIDRLTRLANRMHCTRLNTKWLRSAEADDTLRRICSTAGLVILEKRQDL